ncbi:hypothetical protein Taro_012613 [Colocasia esculenta]|uniref:LysM domain-containing protein n=1 Tax=Colocasia esculenta TaxID=4460 RepID=A0A843UDZ5_COLES|nr:hypothetical protein [Colocasia esculenta]
MSSSAQQPGSGGDGGRGGEGGSKDDAVSKAAGFVVFSGIAMNIVKALTPKFPPLKPLPPPQQPQHPPPPQPSLLPPLHDEATKPAAREAEPSCGPAEPPPKAPQTVEIVQGDTLWGLSRKYGVPISEIKKANGLTGDTIYAGKKLVIP